MEMVIIIKGGVQNGPFWLESALFGGKFNELGTSAKPGTSVELGTSPKPGSSTKLGTLAELSSFSESRFDTNLIKNKDHQKPKFAED